MRGIRINLYIDGQEDQYGLRRWTQVPRVGEYVTVAIDNGLKSLKVLNVFWGLTSASREFDDAEVSIELESPKLVNRSRSR